MTMPRMGDWMQTFSGRKFYPLDPRVEDFFIEDIAHALSLICRFGGHCRTFYSVAEHSVRVSRMPEVEGMRLAALLHDAAEAYLGDMVRPLKRHMPAYRCAEGRAASCIEERFGLHDEALCAAEIHQADEILLATEARDLMGGESADKWHLRARPLAETIEPWTSPNSARNLFLARFYELGGKQ